MMLAAAAALALVQRRGVGGGVGGVGVCKRNYEREGRFDGFVCTVTDGTGRFTVTVYRYGHDGLRLRTVQVTVVWCRW